MKQVNGFKATDLKMSCRGFEFDLNKKHTHNDMVIPCKKGFHFCENIVDTLRYYDISSRLFHVIGSGEIYKYDDKTISSEIIFTSEVDYWELLNKPNQHYNNNIIQLALFNLIRTGQIDLHDEKYIQITKFWSDYTLNLLGYIHVNFHKEDDSDNYIKFDEYIKNKNIDLFKEFNNPIDGIIQSNLYNEELIELAKNNKLSRYSINKMFDNGIILDNWYDYTYPHTSLNNVLKYMSLDDMYEKIKHNLKKYISLFIKIVSYTDKYDQIAIELYNNLKKDEDITFDYNIVSQFGSVLYTKKLIDFESVSLFIIDYTYHLLPNIDEELIIKALNNRLLQDLDYNFVFKCFENDKLINYFIGNNTHTYSITKDMMLSILIIYGKIGGKYVLNIHDSTSKRMIDKLSPYANKISMVNMYNIISLCRNSYHTESTIQVIDEILSNIK